MDDEIYERIDEIEMSTSATKAEEFEALAHSMAAGEQGRALSLSLAGEQWKMREEYDDARRCFELALDDGGQVEVHPVASLLDLALETGDEPQASSLALELRALVRQGDLNVDSCHFVGEAYEEHERLPEAMRWFTIPLTHVDPDDVDDLDFFCLSGRRRVRRRLGLPADRYDLAADAALEASRGML